MSHPPAPLYHAVPKNLGESFHKIINRSVTQLNSASKIEVFFRADDIGVPGRQYNKMISLFNRFNVPLCLALVPSWLSNKRLEALTKDIDLHSSRYCFHQHGYLHRNHAIRGKKQEFGPSRSESELFRDLSRGKKRLEALLGNAFFPVFTPPWNRCSKECMTVLSTLNFLGISRFHDASSSSPAPLKDMSVSVDLHTRKETEAKKDWDLLFHELEQWLSSGRCGIMLHHQRMDQNSFSVLKIFLKSLSSHNGIKLITFRDLLTL